MNVSALLLVYWHFVDNRPKRQNLEIENFPLYRYFCKAALGNTISLEENDSRLSLWNCSVST